jgi:menaquinone-dependent protoporphyrinogen oxidase
MHIIVIYSTVEGQTRKIARNISATVQSLKHAVTVYDADDLGDLDLATADAIIVAAPVHMGKYPDAIGRWLKANPDALRAIPGAFISVSLASASAFPEEHREISDITRRFLAETGWKPKDIHHAAGALRYTSYDFIKRLLMRHLARQEGGPLDTTRDHEFTDWKALSDFVGAFLRAL